MITVKYSCKACGADKIELTVPSRKEVEGGYEDVVGFVRETARLVGIHHSYRECAATVCDLMIPVSGDVVGLESEKAETGGQ